MNKVAKKEKILPLTGIRFPAAILAVLSNMSLWGDVDPGFARRIDWGWLTGIVTTPFRVDIFFLLSGFLLIYIYEKKMSSDHSIRKVLNFYFLRLTRIYPLHLFSLFLILLLNNLGVWDFQTTADEILGNRIQIPRSGLANFSLTSSWGFFPFKVSWNGPAWSLSAEWFNYLLFPLIPFIFFKIKSIRSHIIFILVIMSGFSLLIENESSY